MHELLNGLRVWQLVITDAQLEMLWPILDIEKQGSISLENFQRFMTKKLAFSYKDCADKFFRMPHAKELHFITDGFLPGVTPKAGPEKSINAGSSLAKRSPLLSSKRLGPKSLKDHLPICPEISSCMLERAAVGLHCNSDHLLISSDVLCCILKS